MYPRLKHTHTYIYIYIYIRIQLVLYRKCNVLALGRTDGKYCTKKQWLFIARIIKKSYFL